MPFVSSLSGVGASLNSLNVLGNNLANLSTTGFKSSRPEYSDVFATSALGGQSNATGAGVKTANIAQQFTQGNLVRSDSPLDLAISGEGFFVLNDGGARVLSRDGNFFLNKSGNISNSSQQLLMGFTADDNGIITGQLAPLKIDNAGLQPRATTELKINVNIDAASTEPSIAFDPNFTSNNPPSSNSFNFKTSTTAYDSLGNAATVDAYFIKTANPNEYNVAIAINGEAATGGTLPTVQFNSSGQLTGDGTISLNSFDTGTGANPLQFDIQLAGSTQFAGTNNVRSIEQNGYNSGNLTGLEIDNTGIISTRFNNGQSKVIGQVALANPPSTDGLQGLGSNLFAETFASGDAALGTPGSNSLGLIQSGFLESSNTSLSGDLVSMIVAQRNFQANVQSIRTADAVTQSLINIR